MKIEGRDSVSPTEGKHLRFETGEVLLTARIVEVLG